MSEAPDLAARIEAMLADWMYFHEVLSALAGSPYRAVLGAWSDVRERFELQRDAQGRYKRT